MQLSTLHSQCSISKKSIYVVALVQETTLSCFRESKNGFDILKSSQIYFKWSSLSLSRLEGNKVITARKRNLWRLCFYTCLSVILFSGGGVSASGYYGIRSTSGRYESYWNAFLFSENTEIRFFIFTAFFVLTLRVTTQEATDTFKWFPFKQTVLNIKLVYNLSLNVHMAWVYKNPWTIKRALLCSVKKTRVLLKSLRLKSYHSCYGRICAVYIHSS